MSTPAAKKIQLPPKILKKGEMLFNEGDPSSSMYFIQAGTLRLFKKKGDSAFELGTLHKGEVVGEMGFLDAGPRSASAEALHDCVLIEITNNNLVEQLKVLPSWLLVLLRTVVNRLRQANNKIRQLETTQTSYTYGSEGLSTTYQFLPMHDVLKIMTSLLLCASRYGQQSADGVRCSMSKISRYATQIMAVHNNKITELFDILQNSSILKVHAEVLDKIEVTVLDLNLLDSITAYLNEENLKEHSKKTALSVKAVNLMHLIVKYMSSFPPNADGIAEVNLATIIQFEKGANGRDPFRMDEVGELAKVGLCTEVQLKNSNTMLTKINVKEFTRAYKLHSLVKAIDALNEQKREQAQKAAGVGKR